LRTVYDVQMKLADSVQAVEIAAVVAEGIEPPHYATDGAAGMDLRANVHVRLAPMERKMVPTGVRLAIPEGFEAQVRPRSGLASRHGVTMVNSPGTIDSDYRGEIQVILINLGQDAVEFKRGERIAQLVVSPVAKARLVFVDSLEDTARGEGGFGSTGNG
jgi:dUTP pyrophosphatase